MYIYIYGIDNKGILNIYNLTLVCNIADNNNQSLFESTYGTVDFDNVTFENIIYDSYTLFRTFLSSFLTFTNTNFNNITRTTRSNSVFYDLIGSCQTDSKIILNLLIVDVVMVMEELFMVI